MSRLRILGRAGLVVAMLLAACSGGSIATVNGDPISRSEFNARLESSPAARPVMQQLVQETLLEQYAKNNGITVTTAEIDARENQLKANFSGDTWSQMLASRGLTESDVRGIIQEQLVMNKALATRVTITPAQIKDYFKKNHARFDKPAQAMVRHMLVPNPALASQVDADVKSGKSFSALAKKYSIDPPSKTKGEPEPIVQGQLTPTADNYAFSAPIGQVSPPIKTPFGYYILQVESRIPTQKATLAGATPQIIQQLREQQEGPLSAPFLQSLEQKAEIKVNDPALATIYATPPPASSAAASAAAATTK